MIVNLFLSTLMFFNVSCSSDDDGNQPPVVPEAPEMNISIMTSANSWVYKNPSKTNTIITDNGIDNWKDTSTKIRTYFRVEKTGQIHIGLKAKVTNGSSVVKVTFNGVTATVDISKTSFEKIFADSFTVAEPGYHFVEIQGVSKTGSEFGEVSHILIGGAATNGDLYYVKEDVYWGRRGPSVHLSYEKPEAAGDVLWFYNEMTIPEGEDKLGTYFMANGFGEGYFGIQVNSEIERRVLFSVWSAYSTDDPSQIPADYKVEKLAAGADVTVQDFGNEGSGLQSIRRYNWEAGTTYKFLLKAEPSENNSTDYTAYFFSPEIGEWELMSSLRRPKTSTYLSRPHSFLENFSTAMGDESRKVLYTNQWVYDTSATWHQISKVRFTADATARKDSRLDYAGGVEGENFFLKNCGFFSDKATIDSYFEKPLSGSAPTIDFESLPID